MVRSIKFKFSVFLAVLLLLTVAVLSFLVLDRIKRNQQKQYEAYLAQQAETTNLYFVQLSLSEPFLMPEDFLSSGGNELAAYLSQVSGLPTLLYDTAGIKVGESIPDNKAINLNDALSYALLNKIVYQEEGDILYYLYPMTKNGRQIGILQLNYYLTENIEFYNYIRMLFIYIGAGVFAISFILGYIYFNSFANVILKLKKMTDRIRGGDYNIEVSRRRDELGKLGEGIYDMSRQILKTIDGMKQEQEKLTLAVNKLSALEKQQREFIGNVTHEFKTPLTSVKAYLDLLEMYPDDESLMITSKDNIRRETERLYDMVDKVLQLSALEKYDFEYTIEKINIRELIIKVCNSLKGKMDKFGIEAELILDEQYIEADKENMVIILINLLDNAIKYNKPQGKIIIRSYKANQKVYIEISDTGIGIPPEAAEKIFEPFYTVDKNRARMTGGAGLGLSLTKKLIEKQGGSISLMKTNSDGSTFMLSFPNI
jgi:two-component system phosphate regulon sensor histidine kinase PhoR